MSRARVRSDELRSTPRTRLPVRQQGRVEAGERVRQRGAADDVVHVAGGRAGARRARSLSALRRRLREERPREAEAQLAALLLLARVVGADHTRAVGVHTPHALPRPAGTAPDVHLHALAVAHRVGGGGLGQGHRGKPSRGQRSAGK